MIKAASKLFCAPMEPDDIVDKEDAQTVALLDIAKSLAIIADGITTQNEQIEKIKSDISSIENINRAKMANWPPR